MELNSQYHYHLSLDTVNEFEEYITELERLGYQGMLITDHNSYNGYRWWKKNIN